MDEVGMLVCDRCGCVVEITSLQVHSDWHDSVDAHPTTANPGRTQVE